MKTQITFEFETLEEASAFLGNVSVDKPKIKTVKAKPAKPVKEPKEPKSLEQVYQEREALGYGAEVIDIGPVDEEIKQGEAVAIETNEPTIEHNITARQVQDSLRNYKKDHGHAKYKEILTYFGVNAVRDIPKSEFPNVIRMVEKAEAEKPPEMPVMPEVPDFAPEPPVVPATAEELRRALSKHKARWGQVATQNVLNDFGYPKPVDIPQDKYRDLIEVLETHDPLSSSEEKNDLGVDLSSF